MWRGKVVVIAVIAALLSANLAYVGKAYSWETAAQSDGQARAGVWYCPIPAAISIMPKTLNVTVPGGETSITVIIRFPDDIPSFQSVNLIESASMSVEGQSGSISSVANPANGNSQMLKFTKSALVTLLNGQTGEATLIVRGVVGSCEFLGMAQITINVPGSSPSTSPNQGQQSIQQKSTNEPVQIQGETEKVEQVDPVIDPPAGVVEQGGSTNEPKETDPALNEPEQGEQAAPASGPEQGNPPQDEATVIDEDNAGSEPVKTAPSGNDIGATPKEEPVKPPVKTNPPGNESALIVDDASKTEPAKPGPKDEEPDTVQQKPDELVKEPVKTNPAPEEIDTQEKDVPVKQPLEIDPPENTSEIVAEPVDEPEIVEEDEPVIMPIPTRPRADQPEKVARDVPVVTPIPPTSTVNEPEDIEDVENVPVVEPAAPEPPVDDPVLEPEEPVVDPPVENAPPEDIADEPAAVEQCPIDAGLQITPRVLDLNGDVDEALLTVRFPETVAGVYAVDGVALVQVRVKLGEDQYGALTVDAKPDATNPRAGEFELTLEQVVTLLEGRLDEVTLEVRGSMSDCAFAGTDTFEVIETEVEEPSVPEAVVDESSGEEIPVETTEPVDEDQTQAVSTEGGEQEPDPVTEDVTQEQPEATGSGEQQPADPVEDAEQIQPPPVDGAGQVGILTPEEDESGAPEGTE